MTLPAVNPAELSLADTVRALGLAVTVGGATCVWCGSDAVNCSADEGWPPHGVVRCQACGSELEIERRLWKLGAA